MLEMLITKRIGRRQFHFTVKGTNLHETTAAYQQLSFEDVRACGLCGSDNLDLSSRVAQGKFKYTSVKCLDCRGSVTFGKRQEDENTYFLRRKEGSSELDWQDYSSVREKEVQQ